MKYWDKIINYDALKRTQGGINLIRSFEDIKMAIVKVETELSTDKLLKAVCQLNKSELEQFVSQVINLRAQRLVHSLSQAEAQLIVKINQGLPPKVQKRYDELIDKRRDESLSSEEYGELLRLTDQIENLEAQRMQYLSELASYRKVDLSELMKNMGIQPPAYA